jgi:hypothetical protein
LTSVIINGRALIEPQVKALRGALRLADGQIDAGYDTDRLTEILQMLDASPAAISASGWPEQEKMMVGLHNQRVNRVLQLAGYEPEKATAEARRLAEGYVTAGVRNDEAAIRLQRALNANMRGEA